MVWNSGVVWEFSGVISIIRSRNDLPEGPFLSNNRFVDICQVVHVPRQDDSAA
jgi:hypothetical protein